MTNFVRVGVPRIQIGLVEFGVVKYDQINDLNVFNHLGQIGYAKFDNKYRIVHIDETIDAIQNDTIAKDRVLISLYNYDTIEELKTYASYGFHEQDKLYYVVGTLDYEGYKDVLGKKIGYYTHF